MTTETSHALEEPRPATLPSVHRSRRRRRPTGAPAPLPRHVGVTGWVWLVATLLLLMFVSAASEPTGWAGRVTAQTDAAILREIVRVRTPWLTDVMKVIDRAGAGWFVFLVGIGLTVTLIVFKRWRHLFTLIASLIVLEVIGDLLYHSFQRPHPVDVTIIGPWAGFSMPAPPVAVLAFLVVGITYSLVVPGGPRAIAKAVGTVVLAAFIAAELYLGVYHPFDVLVAVAVGVAIPLNAFRFFTPNELFPVAYRQGKTAHLDVGGRRGEALRQAVQDQLGLTVLDVRPVGLAGSGGSTPLLITVEGEPPVLLFGKLYAMSHVRADRWYKLGRLVLYGRLEDEAPFQSVRRLVQYEDYALRLLRDVGIPTAAPHGIVELTPEREYLLVTEFFDGAEEISEAEVDDQVIDQGLRLIRQMWDVGLAHRDIKPANLLVRDGRMLLIDVAFAQIRSSPWRQAVDLANMMLVLAVRTDAQRVYRRACLLFSEDDIAEAFAAARGIASPSQLRAVMKSDGRDLLAQFRTMAPDRRPISLQRWSVRRVAVALALLFGAYIGVQATGSLFTPARNSFVTGTPDCGNNRLAVLLAQAVPSATSVPCVAALPAGWTLGGVRIRSGEGTFWLDSDVGGPHAVEVSLLPSTSCETSDAMEVPSDEVGMRRYEQPDGLPPNLRSTRSYVLPGGCITYRLDLEGGSTATLLHDIDSALGFHARGDLVEFVDREVGLRLCGADAPPCGGGT